MHTQKISFENASGHRLAGVLDLPVDDEPIAYALFAHCFTCSKNYKPGLLTGFRDEGGEG